MSGQLFHKLCIQLLGALSWGLICDTVYDTACGKLLSDVLADKNDRHPPISTAETDLELNNNNNNNNNKVTYY
jgi:hypothetical protein